jgi:hypothetical protein
MSGTRWHLLTTAPNAPCAHALVQSLRARGIDSKVVSDSTLLGEARVCRIMVAESLAARAHQMLEEGQFTDAELAFLATGAASCDDAKE